MRGSSNLNHRTISLHEKEDIYVRTYTTFFSKDYLKDTEDKENQKFKVLIPEYDPAFDETASDFTFLDTMAKPVKYIEVPRRLFRTTCTPLRRSSSGKETTSRCCGHS